MSLALALAVADPITAAPAAVRSYRSLMQNNSVSGEAGGQIVRLLNAHGAFVANTSLGTSLELLVDLLSGPTDEAVSELLREAAFTVRLVRNQHFPHAQVRFGDALVQYGTPPDHDPPIRQEAVVAYPVFVTLGRLWYTTQAYRVQTPLGEIVRQIRRRRRPKSSQTAIFRPDENTAELLQEPATVFPNQPHTQSAQLERRTFGKLSAHTHAHKHQVPAAGPPTPSRRANHGPAHPDQPGAD